RTGRVRESSKEIWTKSRRLHLQMLRVTRSICPEPASREVVRRDQGTAHGHGKGQEGRLTSFVVGIIHLTQVFQADNPRSNGQLGTVVSSARFKKEIQPMDEASEAILALKPVTFRYKQELDPDAIPQFGLVAEEVEKVNPDLVVRDDQG